MHSVHCLTLKAQGTDSKPSEASASDGISTQMTGSATASSDSETKSSIVKKIEFSSNSTMRLIHPDLDISLVTL